MRMETKSEHWNAEELASQLDGVCFVTQTSKWDAPGKFRTQELVDIDAIKLELHSEGKESPACAVFNKSPEHRTSVAPIGKSVDVTKVIFMIEELVCVCVLQQEETDDDNKKTYRLAGLSRAEDQCKSLAIDIKNLKSVISDLVNSTAELDNRLPRWSR